MPWPEVAASAYRAFAACYGAEQPSWDKLPGPARAAWQAAVRQAGACIQAPHVAMQIEATWAGWVPPY